MVLPGNELQLDILQWPSEMGTDAPCNDEGVKQGLCSVL
jgi:hypothetical protein